MCYIYRSKGLLLKKTDVGKIFHFYRDHVWFYDDSTQPAYNYISLGHPGHASSPLHPVGHDTVVRLRSTTSTKINFIDILNVSRITNDIIDLVYIFGIFYLQKTLAKLSRSFLFKTLKYLTV